MEPILFFKDGRILFFQGGKFFLTNSNDEKPKLILSTSFGKKEKFLSRFSLPSRLYRLGIRNVIQIDLFNVLIYINHKFYEINIEEGSISDGWSPGIGRRALKLTQIENIKGFDDGIYLGEYFGNSTQEPVNIHKRISKDNWQIVYIFPKGTINHIHALVQDKENECVWILTGDWRNSAAIWMAKNNFKTVEPILRGNQKYRSCVAFPVKGGLLYATDTPFQENSIRLLKQKDNVWISEEICKLPGTCIYGTLYKGKYVFSTVVEPQGEKGGWRELLSIKKGTGIKDYWCHLYYGNLEEGFKEIYKVRKDFMPMGLFQFGSLSFIEGQEYINDLYIHHTSTIKHNLKTIKLKWN